MPYHRRDGSVRPRRTRRSPGRNPPDRAPTAPSALNAAGPRGRHTGALSHAPSCRSGPEAEAAALAQSRGLAYVDARASAPDCGLAGRMDLADVLAYRAMPWALEGGGLVLATPDPDRALPLLGARATRLVVISNQGFQGGLGSIYGEEIAARALTRTPRAMSARSLTGARHAMVLAVMTGAMASMVAGQTVLVLLAAIVFLSAATTALTRLVALVFSRRDDRSVRSTPDAMALADYRPPPTVSLLIPLFREAAVLPRLLTGLERLDYPRDRLDVKLLVEPDDPETRQALEELTLPDWIEVLILPPGGPRTKPRALNVALDFCKGDIVGILDAEDRPDPAQLTAIADHLHHAAPEVAAVQCQLAYFNARENWITRCFQIEYAIWFSVLLGGWQRMGLPIPLGGTSVYFRRSALVALGGWDAHNVTEDADLGMRIARAGLRCDVVGSTTEEEANCRLTPWIRQRSRWLKGYMMTWLSHMRSPGRLWTDLGPAGFLGFQVLLLGGVISYLAMPLLWLALILGEVGGTSIYGSLPDWALVCMAVTFGLGQAVMLAAAALALWRRRTPGLIWWVPTLLVYWTLGAAAAWKALAELAVAPYFWDKTRHGVTRMSPDREEPAQETSR